MRRECRWSCAHRSLMWQPIPNSLNFAACNMLLFFLSSGPRLSSLISSQSCPGFCCSLVCACMPTSAAPAILTCLPHIEQVVCLKCSGRWSSLCTKPDILLVIRSKRWQQHAATICASCLVHFQGTSSAWLRFFHCIREGLALL